MLSAMRKEICKGRSAVFDLEEYLERIPAPVQFQDLVQNRFRPSSAFFYPDLYAYIKHHTMPIVMEIGLVETGWRALKGLLDFGLCPPPEYKGAFPVDHIGVDFGNLVVHSYGETPGNRRASRSELQSKQDGMLSFYLGPMFEGRAGACLALGRDGVAKMAGSIPLRKMGEYPACTFPVECEAARRVLEGGRERFWLPLMTKANAETLPDVQAPELGMTLQMFLPIGHRKKLHVKEVQLNGVALQASRTYGYELICGSDGWHVFVNLPPDLTKTEKLFCIIVSYEILN